MSKINWSRQPVLSFVEKHYELPKKPKKIQGPVASWAPCRIRRAARKKPLMP